MRKSVVVIGLACLLLSLAACAGPAAPAPVGNAPAASAPAAATPVASTAPVQTPAAAAPAGAKTPAATAAQAPVPAGGNLFVLTNLKITPGKAVVGNDVTVTVTMTNPGTQPGTDQAILNLVMDGEGCPSFIPIVQDVTLAGKASKDLTFKVSMGPGSAGVYTVYVGSLSGNLIVE